MMKFATKNQKLSAHTSVFTAAALALAFTPAAFAGKGHGAHEHGVANVNVVGEGNTVTIQLQAPSDSIYGFEHEAKKEADIKKRDTAIEKLKNSAEQMFVLEPSLGCKVTSSDIKPFVTDSSEQKDSKNQAKANKNKEGTHSEVHATFKFECGKPVAGSKLSFAARKHFKSLRTLKIQVLSGEKQDGATIKNDKGTVSL